jgi:uncharacterized RDD family membrane protein YckC
MYPLMTAAAPALEALPGGRPLHAPSAPPEAETGYRPAWNPQESAEYRQQPSEYRPQPAENRPQPAEYRQPSLFRDSVPGPKVVPIPTLTPMHPSPKRSATRGSAPRAPRRGSDRDVQQSLDFNAGRSLGAQSLDMQVETVIYCDAPVALPLHRFIAAAIDASMVLIALGLFLAVFLLSGGHVLFNKQVAPVFVAAVGLMWAMYHMFWCMANGDTPGMRFAGLRVMNFDGRAADRKQRGLRQVAFVLSVLSAGVGLFWALVDEENLTWHDHISKTFPTPG